MRLITVKAPKEKRNLIVDLALSSEIEELSINEVEVVSKNGEISKEEHIAMETNAPKAKKFLEALMDAPFYNPKEIKFYFQATKKYCCF